MINVELPWPPSVNKYWRRNGSRYFISKEGQRFKRDVGFLCSRYKGMFIDKQRLSISIAAYPPDKRRRDLDNILKVLFDSLEAIGVFEDDSQIDEIFVKRQPELEAKVMVNLKVCS